MRPSNFQKLLAKSLWDHFEGYKGSYELGLEDKIKVEGNNYFVLRYDGPISLENDSQVETFDIPMNVLIAAQVTKSNVYLLDEMIDLILPALGKCINIKNLADTTICTIQRLDNEIEINQYGEGMNTQHFATLETMYRGTI